MAPESKPDQVNLPVSRDEKFLRKVRETVEANLENEKFGVEQLASAMAISRIQLYRKLHRLTGKNVTQYIREIRLEKAMELLRQDVASVAEIAYRVGFGSPAYFNRCFHDFYGHTPGEVFRQKERTVTGEKVPGMFWLIRNQKKFPNQLIPGIGGFEKRPGLRPAVSC